MIEFLCIYLSGMLLFALRLGHVMWFKLDRFDWDYHYHDIWVHYIAAIVFWPFIFFFTPGLLWNAKQLFVFDIVLGGLRLTGLGQRMRELHLLAKKPPPCAKTIYFRFIDMGATLDEGVSLWFEAEELVKLYKGKNLPLYSDFEQAALVSWIKNRNKTQRRATEVPDKINFKNVAASLLDAGFGEVECKTCAIRYRASELNSQKPPLHRGWNDMTYFCPKGHPLLKHNYVHISM